VHESTKFTPHELVFGKSTRIPTNNLILASDLSETYVDCLTSQFNRLRNSQELISDNLNRTKQRAKHYYDRKVNPRAFKYGDRVYLLKEPVKGKLADQYTRSHEVLEI